MFKNENPGKFIVFDSLDGSGQSTQVSLLRDFLMQKGKQAIATKEPTTDSDAGRKIKDALEKKIKLESLELQKLFTEDRKEHLDKLVVPALKDGKSVLSDRYFFSTFAYGASDGLDIEELIKMNDNFLLPDLAFFLKVRPSVCMERIGKRGTATTLFEKEQKLARVWETYEKMPQRFENIHIIDGEKSIGEIHQEIIKIVDKIL